MDRDPNVDVLGRAFRIEMPVLLWGPPGVGKTAAIRALARSLGVRLFEPVIKTPEDLMAVVLNERGNPEQRPIELFDQVARAAEDGDAIVFVDELTTLTPSAQGAMLAFLGEGVLAGRRLPPNVWRVAAANPPELAAGGFDLEPPVANRLWHRRWVLEPARWADDFTAYWGQPVRPPRMVTADTFAMARGIVAEYIRRNPDELLCVPDRPGLDGSGGAWPSPRTWEAVARLVACRLADGEESWRVSQDVQDIIGPGHAVPFVSWLREADLPDPSDYVDNPDAPLPERGDQLHALTMALAAHVLAAQGRERVRRWTSAWAVLGRVAAGFGADVAYPAARRLAQARGKNMPIPPQAKAFLPILGIIGGGR